LALETNHIRLPSEAAGPHHIIDNLGNTYKDFILKLSL